MENRNLRGVSCCPWNADWVCCWSGESRDVRLYESTNGKLLLKAMLPEIVSSILLAKDRPPPPLTLPQVSMPRSFAWGPKTPTGTCAVGLINGRVAVTRLLPQVNAGDPFSILCPPASPSVAATRRRVRCHATQRTASALCAVSGLERGPARCHCKRSR